MSDNRWKESMMELEALRHKDLMAVIAANSEQIAANTYQIGVLSESITQLGHKVDRIATATEQQLEVAKIQAASIDKLIGYVTSRN